MKKAVIFFAMVVVASKWGLAQDSTVLAGGEPRVEQSDWGVEAGLLGFGMYKVDFALYGHYEHGLSERFSFRTEVGFVSVIYYDLNNAIYLPKVSFEPRWYYFLNEEDFLSKNSGSFLTMRVEVYVPLVCGCRSLIITSIVNFKQMLWV